MRVRGSGLVEGFGARCSRLEAGSITGVMFRVQMPLRGMRKSFTLPRLTSGDGDAKKRELMNVLLRGIHDITDIHTHACMHACMHAYIHTYIHTDRQTDKQTNKQTYIHTYIHTYTHTLIRSYIHTFTHT